MTTMTVYIDDGTGTLTVIDEHRAKLFNLLSKLGIKSVPTRRMTVVASYSMSPGTYTISGTVNGKQSNATITVSEPVEQLKVELPKVTKLRTGPDRDQRREWRKSSQRHSRNTGRNTGRR